MLGRNLLSLIFLSSFNLLEANEHIKGNVYNFLVEDALGKSVSLSKFKGKVLLIVNVASECGYTESQYQGLVRLQSELGHDHFQVLAFPCNDFGQQEPLPVQDIVSQVKSQYGVNFPIFQKVSIVVGETSPLFKYLQEQTGEKVKWNFYKFLISSDGEPLLAWGPSTSVESIIPIIRDQVLVWKQRAGQTRGSRSEF